MLLSTFGLILSLLAVFAAFHVGNDLYKRGRNDLSIVFFLLGLVNFVFGLSWAYDLANKF